METQKQGTIKDWALNIDCLIKNYAPKRSLKSYVCVLELDAETSFIISLRASPDEVAITSVVSKKFNSKDGLEYNLLITSTSIKLFYYIIINCKKSQ